MRVVATAGHVDHGKSTLVRALTGMEPDRWAEERRRGMTIDLGYAWTTLGDDLLAFVDVPGHERFLANMLAGLGPVPAVMFVVAADQGWQAQSDEHLTAVRALGLDNVLLVITRSDLRDPADTLANARARLRATGLMDVPAVAVSGATGAGLDELRAALSRLVTTLPPARTDGRVRLWVDRSFTVTGAGTVVTGTLDAGSVSVGDEFDVGSRCVRVRGVQSAGEPHDRIAAVARVALNLRGVDRADVGRGDVLLTPGSWLRTALLDVCLDESAPALSGEFTLHVGTAAVEVRARPLGAGFARLQLATPLPLVHGDRAILRNPGSRAIVGAEVFDADPPPLRRRGAAGRRAAELATVRTPTAATELARRGAVPTSRLRQLGFDPQGVAAAREVAGWLVDDAVWSTWSAALTDAVDDARRADPLRPGLSHAAATARVALPDVALLGELAADAGLTSRDGMLMRPDTRASLGRAEAAVSDLELRLRATPFRAPERQELAELGLGNRELAAAVRAGRLLRLAGDVVLLVDAPALAIRTLAALQQPFSTSDARIALGTTRRVVIPLLEHLDGLGLTERIDPTSRRVR